MQNNTQQDYATTLMNKWLNKSYKVTQTPGPAAASTRKYYRIHQGYDYATPSGTPLTAKTSGKVVYAGYDPSGWGNRVGIYEPSTGKTTYLSHLSDIRVKAGQQITPGMYLGATGGIPGSRGSGNTTGAHLDITEYGGNKIFPSYAQPRGKQVSVGRQFVNNDMRQYAASVMQKAKSKYGKKVLAVGSSPQVLQRLGLKGRIVRL